MWRICEIALAAAAEAGADYADVRVVESRWRSVRTLGGHLDGIERGRRIGLGVRARTAGAWGFAATTDLSLGTARMLGQRAAALAEASGLLLSDATPLAPAPVVTIEVADPMVRDPFEVFLKEQSDLLIRAEIEMRGAPAVQTMTGRVAASRSLTHFASSEGHLVLAERTVCGVAIQALARTEGGTAVRSFPQGGGGYFAVGGYEHVEAVDLVGNAFSVADEITQLIYAVPAPNGPRTVVLTGGAVGDLLYRTLGPLLCADRVTGTAGVGDGPRIGIERLGEAQIAGELVTISAVQEPGSALGTYRYDAEGVRADSLTLVEAGRWVGLLTDRETAGQLGHDTSTGSARAADFNRAPRVQPGNLRLAGGTATLEDLVAGVSDGLLVDGLTDLHVEADGRFAASFEVGWRLRSGRTREMVRRPVLRGNVTHFWQQCEAIGRDDEAVTTSIIDAPTDWPVQFLAGAVLAPPARFAAIETAPYDGGRAS